MKLKNVLVISFLTLTLIPIIIVSLLLYKSGFDLSKESYTRNLRESINVQVDYVSQTIENNMISDYRFANRSHILSSILDNTSHEKNSGLFEAFESYLEAAEDKITVCILLDSDRTPIYTIGEKTTLDIIMKQLPKMSELTTQKIMELELSQGTYSLCIITPVWDDNNEYAGSLISVYDKSYLFKIISSYYKIANTSTYICRGNGDIINFKNIFDEKVTAATEQALDKLTLAAEGDIEMHIGSSPVYGYYKSIHNSPWYLVGLIDNKLISSFTNQFILVYILFACGVIIADIFLSFYFSRKVVEPINGLIKVMEQYQNNFNSNELQFHEKSGYYETRYLRKKFISLMKKIMLVQHNFEGMYQLYQSSDMDDTNIDIDVKNQTILSSKKAFEELMNELDFPKDACIVEKFTNCFCDKDQLVLTDMFEKMRSEHLSVTCEAEIYTPHLNQKWFHTLVVPVYENDRLSRLFIQLRDISSFKKQEYQSIEQARRDSLTGLYNRSGFIECVSNILNEKDRKALHGLLFIDMDYFKLVNDNLGHSAGDDLLRLTGNVLQSCVSSDDIVSRFGGDEFAVFLPDTSVEIIAKIKKAMKKSLVYPFNTEKTSFVVSASIGVSTWDNMSPNTLDELLKQADASMYQAKRELKQQTGN